MITAVKNTSDTFHISSLEKEVKLKPYTRAISRAYEEALLRGVIVRGDGSTDTPAINGSKAEEEMLRLLFGLSLEDMDNIEHDDYQELRRIVDEKNTEKKKQIARTLREIRSYLSGSQDSIAPRAYVDYLLCSKIWHCTPSELEKHTEEEIELYIGIYSEILRAKDKEDKRAAQAIRTAS